jgi:hypothetical protein
MGMLKTATNLDLLDLYKPLSLGSPIGGPPIGEPIMIEKTSQNISRLVKDI